MNKIKLKHKSKRLAIKFALSFAIALVIVIVYESLGQEIIEKLDDPQEEANFDYDVINPITSDQVLGKSTQGEFGAEVTYYNFRARVFDLYFKKNNSPLYGHGQDFIDACRKYNAPEHCTLLPAIARVETDLCKTDLSEKQHNCWGFGGSGENRLKFDSFPESIDYITGRIMNGYGARFFNDPNAGELFYCGDHCNNWGEHVRSVQIDLEQFSAALGYDL